VKKPYRAIIFMLLLISCVFGLSACSGNDEQDTSQTIAENNQNIIVDSSSQNPSNSGITQGSESVADVQTSPMIVMAGIHNLVTMFYITAEGELWAWGRGEQGQLGNSTLQDSFVPVQVHIENVVTVATGRMLMNDSIYALDSNGVVHAWGLNHERIRFEMDDGVHYRIFGTLGLGENEADVITVPTPLQLPRIKDIVVANHFGSTFAITESGDVYAWGATEIGSVGYDSWTHLSTIFTPQRIPELSNIVQIYSDKTGVTIGSAIHAVDSNGDVWVWGGLLGNLGVMLGEISEEDASIIIPAEYNDGVPVLGIINPIRLTKIRDVERIIDMTTFLMQNGARWGLADGYFIEIQLGHEQIIDHHISAFIPHHNDVSFFLDSNGYLHQPFIADFWHESEATGGIEISPSTVVNFDPNPLRGVYNVASMLFTGSLWGRPNPQQLLLFMKDDATVWSYEIPNAPMQFEEISGAVSIQVIDSSIFVILETGDVWAWGNNRGGRLGMGFAEDSTPETVVENPVLIRFD